MATLTSVACPRAFLHEVHRPFDSPSLLRELRTIHLGRLLSLSWSRPSLPTDTRRITCQAAEKERVESSRKYQIEASELFAELLKAKDVRATAQEHVEALTEDFFMIASTYLDLAKKEGNPELVNQLETTLQIALSVKEATLRPEIRLLNQLLREKNEQERTKIIQSNVEYLAPESYFFFLLGRMISDVEKQINSPKRVQLLGQLRMINKETREARKAGKKNKETKEAPKSKGFGV